VRHLRVGLGYSPRNNALLYNLGFSLWMMGRREEAVEPIRQAVESGWRFPELYTLWGVLAIEAGEVDGLRATLERARSITPTDPYLAALLEALALFEGDPEAASRYGATFRAAVSDGRAPGGYGEMVPIYRSLGLRARERGETETAVMLLQRAVDVEPGEPTPHLELARILALAGDRRAAETHYRAATRGNTDAPAILYLLGEVAALLERADEARGYLNRYLDVAPEGPDAARARERLRSLAEP
jgi:tetratricopeptide (TPR) repeat protein